MLLCAPAAAAAALRGAQRKKTILVNGECSSKSTTKTRVQHCAAGRCDRGCNSARNNGLAEERGALVVDGHVKQRLQGKGRGVGGG